MDIGDRLRLIRTEQNLTAKKLSEISGVPEKTIYRIETGEVKDPKLSSLEALIRALNCSADRLLFDKSESGLSGILKHTFEHASKLPIGDRVAIISIIDKYLLADRLNSMIQDLAPPSLIEQMEREEYIDHQMMNEAIQEEEDAERAEAMEAYYRGNS
ncbi:helix-turn-helix domain-containing protein [Motiliproteus sp.]|uniref:helix-turn-helix domain-containing protein n=1 Tax=Motiliproteus sp. TaxID=1898955 RepID=UPI003BABB73B